MTGPFRTAITVVMIIIMIVCGTWLFQVLRKNALLDSSSQFSRTVAENIITTWDQDYFVQVSDPALLANFDEGGITAILNKGLRKQII